jgi:hypothetical protein
VGLRVIGAGLGRTGTHSLKVALEQLLGGPSYHMMEVFGHPEHLPVWEAAATGAPTDWEALFTGYVATVDWPAAAFWRELTATWPDALVVLSLRDDAAKWFKSAHDTIFEVTARGGVPESPDNNGFLSMVNSLFVHRFTPDYFDPDAAMAAYEAHNAEVLAAVPADRLVVWHPGDGWAPLCEPLGLPIPTEPFPHLNSTAEFRAMTGLDPVAPETSAS